MTYRFGCLVGITPISFSFASLDVGSGTNYAAGYYKHADVPNEFNPLINFGTADNPYGTHLFLVSAGGGVGDTVIKVTGTSWSTTTHTRSAVDSENITIVSGEAANTFHRTTKDWIGAVSIELQSGPDVLCNYGFCNTWTNLGRAWTLKGFRATWQGDGNDAGTDVVLYHQKSTGWTYNAGAPADPPLLYSMQTDYNTEYESHNDEFGCYSREGLSVVVDASLGEGIVAALVQSGSRPFGNGTLMLGVFNG